MTSLKCNVTNCTNNDNQLCIRPNIKVDGASASDKEGTQCYSFDHPSTGMQNSIGSQGMAEAMTNVRCDAAECLYNDRTTCTASEILVDGAGADSARDTKCATFKRR